MIFRSGSKQTRWSSFLMMPREGKEDSSWWCKNLFKSLRNFIEWWWDEWVVAAEDGRQTWFESTSLHYFRSWCLSDLNYTSVKKNLSTDTIQMSRWHGKLCSPWRKLLIRAWPLVLIGTLMAGHAKHSSGYGCRHGKLRSLQICRLLRRSVSVPNFPRALATTASCCCSLLEAINFVYD